jgi:hypothetical protein
MIHRELEPRKALAGKGKVLETIKGISQSRPIPCREFYWRAEHFLEASKHEI